MIDVPAEIVLILLVLAVRTCGASGRAPSQHLLVRLMGWVWCLAAAWLAAGLFAAWVPLWPVLAIAVAAAGLEIWRPSHILRVATELVGLLVFFLMSLAPVDWYALLGVVVLLPIIGIALDRWLAAIPRMLGLALVVAPLVGAGVTANTIYGGLTAELLRADRTLPLHLGISAPRAGEFVELDGGAAAWLTLPDSEVPVPGAVFFHGAHWAGSHQPAAFAMKLALERAGFAVLSVDHPGYGRSAAPSVDADVDAWNTLSLARAAVNRLRNEPGVDGVYVVGHSMGNLEVLRILGSGEDVRGGIMLGAGLPDYQSNQNYWYGRFHSDRQLKEQIPRSRWMEIQQRFYDGRNLAASLIPQHAPIVFVQFGIEWQDVKERRGELYAALPGRKRTLDLPGVNHYLSSVGLRGLVLGDTRVTRLLAPMFENMPLELRTLASSGTTEKNFPLRPE